MSYNFTKKLRIEKSQNYSGQLKQGTIPYLKERDYCIIPFPLDGDAPKQFIKAYFYESQSNVYKKNPKTWKSYITKSAEKWYPHESVIEFLINRIGQVLGLRMNNVKLVKVNTQIRFLSEYFLNLSEEVMIHGAEVCGEYLEDIEFAKKIANDKKTARELFSFEFISEAIKTVFPNNYEDLLTEFVKLIVFDAIVGNNDRHFYNWAIIRPIKKGGKLPYFSPIYDSARGLIWNWSDEALKRHLKNYEQDGKKIDKYIKKASPRISIEGNANTNHFDLVAHIYTQYPKYQETINELLSFNNQQLVLKMYSREFAKLFIRERNQLVKLIINTRFNNLRKLTTIL